LNHPRGLNLPLPLESTLSCSIRLQTCSPLYHPTIVWPCVPITKEEILIIYTVRRALLDAPENIATLLRVIALRLFNLISDHTFPSSTNASVASYASSFIKTGAGSVERNTTKEVLNCLRILQRVLPVVFEVEGESSVFELEVLWKKREAEDNSGERDSIETPQFVIEDEEDSEDDHGSRSAKGTPSKSKEKTMLPSLAERLFSCLIDLMFCCGFTLPSKIQVDHHKINYTIWCV
jgi:hypothetical protein